MSEPDSAATRPKISTTQPTSSRGRWNAMLPGSRPPNFWAGHISNAMILPFGKKLRRSVQRSGLILPKPPDPPNTVTTAKKGPPLAPDRRGKFIGSYKSESKQRETGSWKRMHILYAGHGSRIAAHFCGVFGCRQSPGSVRIETFKKIGRHFLGHIVRAGCR